VVESAGGGEEAGSEGEEGGEKGEEGEEEGAVASVLLEVMAGSAVTVGDEDLQYESELMFIKSRRKRTGR
jgi:hypothetical protein